MRTSKIGPDLRLLFQSHFLVRSKSPARCVQLVVQFFNVFLDAARFFDYFVVIEIAFIDNQAQISLQQLVDYIQKR